MGGWSVHQVRGGSIADERVPAFRPDEELVANLKKIRRHDLDGWVLGCLFPTLLAGIGLALGLLRYRSLLLGVAFALAFPAGVFGFWAASVRLLFGSSSKIACELARRAGWPPVEWSSSPRETLTAPDSPDWVLHLSGHALPHGGEHLVWVRVGSDSRLGFSGINLHRATRGDDPRPSFYRKEVRLPDEAAETVRSILDEPKGVALSGEGELVTDGFPFRLTIAGNDGTDLTVSGNLSGGITDDRTRTLVTLLLDLAKEHGRKTPLVGATDAFGNIVISGPDTPHR